MFVAKGLRKIGQTWKGLLRDNVNIIKETGANSVRLRNVICTGVNSNWRSDRGRRIACMKPPLRPIAEHQDSVKAAMITYDRRD
jgi:hypothetical protein